MRRRVVRLNTHGGRAFATAGLSAWNSLPDPVRSPNSPDAAFRLLHANDIFVRIAY